MERPCEIFANPRGCRYKGNVHPWSHWKTSPNKVPSKRAQKPPFEKLELVSITSTSTWPILAGPTHNFGAEYTLLTTPTSRGIHPRRQYPSKLLADIMATEFWKFLQLPKEIQLMIWHFALLFPGVHFLKPYSNYDGTWLSVAGRNAWPLLQGLGVSEVSILSACCVRARICMVSYSARGMLLFPTWSPSNASVCLGPISSFGAVHDGFNQHRI